MLRVLMSIFDPLGLISHYLMFLKIVLQEVWRSGIDWDEEIQPKQFEKWCRWLKQLPLIEDVKIPRCYRNPAMSTASEIELHTFVDASENGFAASSYLRYIQNSTVHCSLVAAKTRVAPLKFHSIPRLELQAAVIGARLAQSIREALSLPIKRCLWWTDSRDVLSWINSDHRRFSQFVAFRVSEILDTTEASQWRWVPTKLNVADEATKWESNPDLTETARWFNGPEFLKYAEADWPQTPSKIASTENELRPSLLLHHTLPESVVAIANFSTWTRLVKVVAFVYRFLHNCHRKSKHDHLSVGPLTTDELQAAEAYLFRQAQYECYPDEVTQLKASTSEAAVNILPKTSRLYKLTPHIDERGVMRMRTRISACQYAGEETKQPIILPRNHHVTTLIIAHYHHKFNHQNHESVVNELRQRYHIPRVRVCYGTVRKSCQRCRNEESVPQPPFMAELPPDRLAAYTRPFTHAGVDFFGPMEVVIGRRVEKRWGLIVICLTTRAIHLELANSLSTSSCIIALQNFMGRRGTPRTIRSDRGTNFIGTSRVLEAITQNVDYEQLTKEFTSVETRWIFNPPASPHMGGCWERLIRSIKKNLLALNPPRKPTEEVLRNLFIEVERTLNSRPLTHVPVDDDSAPALTPNHFILGSSDGAKPLLPLDDDGAVLQQNWRASQALANHFWKRWLSDYLPEIRQRPKWVADCKPIAVDDVVIITDPGLPRNCWPKGRVIEINTSKDGRIRSAIVKTSQGVYERPATKLAVLEVRRDI